MLNAMEEPVRRTCTSVSVSKSWHYEQRGDQKSFHIGHYTVPENHQKMKIPASILFFELA